MCPQVRGSTGYGQEYVALDDLTLRENSVRDIGSLLDWIETQSDLDAKRVLVKGTHRHSASTYQNPTC